MSTIIYRIYHLISFLYCLIFGLKVNSKSIIRFPVSIKGGKYIQLGKNVFIGKNARLFSYSCGEKHGSILIGNDFNAQRNLTISSLGEGHIKIGDNVLIGSDVLIIDNDHVITPPLCAPVSLEKEKQPFKFGVIEIGSNVWIAEKAVI